MVIPPHCQVWGIIALTCDCFFETDVRRILHLSRFTESRPPASAAPGPALHARARPAQQQNGKQKILGKYMTAKLRVRARHHNSTTTPVFGLPGCLSES